jgi:hypothetical protein
MIERLGGRNEHLAPVSKQKYQQYEPETIFVEKEIPTVRKVIEREVRYHSPFLLWVIAALIGIDLAILIARHL